MAAGKLETAEEFKKRMLGTVMPATLTLRDTVALHAVNGLLSNGIVRGICWKPDLIVHRGYEIADSFIRAMNGEELDIPESAAGGF